MERKTPKTFSRVGQEAAVSDAAGISALPPAGARVASWEGRLVSASGFAQRLLEVEAPLSGAPALLYEVRLGLLQRLREGISGRGGGNARETAGTEFLLETRHGTFLVDASRATLEGGHPAPRRLRVRPGTPLERRLLALYRRLGRERPGGKLLAAERLLAGGELVSILGTLTWTPDPRGDPASYRSPPELPCLRAVTVTKIH